VFYNFGNLSGGNVESVSGANPNSSGIPLGVGFSVNSNVGYFPGSGYLKISNPTGELVDWTLICSFQKNSTTDGVLFSNFSEGSIKSGFVLGVTAGNKLYVESYDEKGPIVHQCPTVLGKKNVVAVTKIGQSIYFDYLNGNSKEIISYKVETSHKAFLDSNNWTLGAAPDAPAHFSGNIWNGTIDNFLLINDSIRPSEIQEIFKGIYSTGNPPSENLSYSYSLGMNEVSFLKETDTQDAFDVYAALQTVGVVSLNKDAIYDGVYGEFFGSSDITGAVTAFLNGVAQVPHSGYSVSGTYYRASYTLTGNFLPSGSQFFSNKFYSADDRLVYDNNTEVSLSAYRYNFDFSHDGSVDTFLPYSLDPATDLVFFEGMKLVYNVDYVSVGSGISFEAGNPLYEGMNGALIIAPKHPNVTQLITGQHSVALTNQIFARGTSLVWMNGMRQNLDEDYIEVSSIDPLANVGIFPSEQTLFFNNF
jgi:hypothetical protein